MAASITDAIMTTTAASITDAMTTTAASIADAMTTTVASMPDAMTTTTAASIAGAVTTTVASIADAITTIIPTTIKRIYKRLYDPPIAATDPPFPLSPGGSGFLSNSDLTIGVFFACNLGTAIWGQAAIAGCRPNICNRLPQLGIYTGNTFNNQSRIR